MSIIARQGFKYSIIGYLGFLLGSFSTFFVFPYELEFYGKLRFVFPMAEMLVPVVVFGISFSNVKFFTQAQRDGKHQNMLSLSLLAVLVNFTLFALLYFSVFQLFPNWKNSESWQAKQLILPLILVLSVSAVLNKYISNYKRIVIPNIFENIFPKLANIGAFCLFFFLGFSEETAFVFFFCVFLGSMLGYFFYNNKLEPFHFDFNLDYFKKDNLWLRFLVYSFFGFLGNIGSFLALKIANVMIGEYISFEQNGLYSNIYSIAALIMVPQMGLYNISAPIINRHLADNTLEELDSFHKKTSLSLFFLGLVLFSCIVVGFPFLAGFMKNGEMLKQSQFILWIIGFAMLFDLATGFNSHIISLSNLYRYNTFFMLILACLTIGLNTLFLKFTDFGILGIAVSYAVSLTTFNLIKIIFNYHHFRVFPLSAKMLSALLVCFLAVFSAVLLPEFKTNLLNLIYKPAWVLLVVFSGNYFLKIYPLDKFLNKGFLSSLWKKP